MLNINFINQTTNELKALVQHIYKYYLVLSRNVIRELKKSLAECP